MMSFFEKNKSKISICIAAFNAEEYISQALESALSQDYDNYEIVVIDDASEDNTKNIILAYQRQNEKIKFYENASNLGYLKTFNKLIQIATGDFISFLDADDFISSNKIRLQLEYLESNLDVDFVGCSIFRTDSKGRVVGQEVFPSSISEIELAIDSDKTLPWCGSSIMVRRNLIEKVGGYREFFIGCPAEDYDWILRLLDYGKGGNLAERLYYYRFAEGSLTRKVHYDIKARHAHDIAFFLRDERLSNSCKNDSLSSGCGSNLQDYISKLTNSYIKDPSLLYRKTAFEHAVNGNVRLFFKDFRKTIHLSENYKPVIKVFIFSFIAILFPNSILLRIKNLFTMKSISKTL